MNAVSGSPRPSVAAPPPPSVCVVVPTWNGADLLVHCLAGLAAQTLPADRVIVVDNGSHDDTLQLLADQFPFVEVVALPTNTGFAHAVNRGIERSREDFVVLLNNDAEPEAAWLAQLVQTAAAAPSEIGFVTSKVLDSSGTTVESTGDFLDWSGVPRQRGYHADDDGRWDAPIDVFSGCGGATLYRRNMLEVLGGFDERFFAYYEDVDLCFRGQLRGYRGVLAPGARVRHVGGATSGRIPGMKMRLTMRNGWWLVLKNVPTVLLPRVLVGLALANLANGGYAARTGCFRPYLLGHWQAFRGLPAVLSDRRKVQATRRVSTRALAIQFIPAYVASRVYRKSLRAIDLVIGMARRPVESRT